MPPTEPAVPGCQIVLSGAPLDAQKMSLLLDVTVRDSVHVPDTALVRFRDPEGTFITNNDWAIGKELEIKFAASQKDTFTSVFSGEIIAIEPEYGDNGLVVSYRAYDKGWRLNRERKSAIFPDMTAADIIRKVAASAGLQPGTIADGGPKFDIFQQSMETNWEFCWRLARMHNCEFVVQGNKCHFRKRQVTPPVETLVFGAHQFQQPLLSFKPRLSGVGQVTSVEVRNHDPKSHQQIAGVAQTANIPHTSTRRSQRVADLVRAEISSLLLLEAHDPDVKTVTITDVEVPPDLKSARVFYTARGDEAALARAGEGLARASGFLRREVGRRCGLRYAPELFFVADRSYEQGARIDEILSNVRPKPESNEEP